MKPLALAALILTALSTQAEQGAKVDSPTPSTTAALPLMDIKLPERSHIHIVLSEASDEQQAAFDAGYQSLLLGHLEAARAYFERAIELGLSSPLASVGLILANIGMGQNEAQSAREQAAKEQLASLQLDTILSPQEAHFLDGFSLLLAGKLAQAADSFASKAGTYRADDGLALWAIQLLHEGYDDDGKASLRQTQAIELATQLIERSPENPLAYFMRALIEENAPEISDQAISSAQKAAELLPAEPACWHLLAHLLALKGQGAEALSALEAAETAASAWQRANDLHWRENSMWVRSRLYHITLLHQQGKTTEAQKLLSDTIARRLPISAKYAKQAPTAAELLYHWELKSLAARLLLARSQGSSHQVHQQLLKQGTKHSLKNAQHYLGYTNYQRCLYECLEARLLHKQGKSLEAQKALNNATEIREDLEKSWAAITNYGDRSNVNRAAEACDIGMNLARSDIFNSTRELWLEKLKRESRKSSLLMPRIVPAEFGDE